MQYHGIETTEIPDDVIDPTHQRRGYGIGKSNSDELIGRQSMVEQARALSRLDAVCTWVWWIHRIDQFSWPKACDYVYPVQQVRVLYACTRRHNYHHSQTRASSLHRIIIYYVHVDVLGRAWC